MSDDCIRRQERVLARFIGCLDGGLERIVGTKVGLEHLRQFGSERCSRFGVEPVEGFGQIGCFHRPNEVGLKEVFDHKQDITSFLFSHHRGLKILGRAHD
ncbi:hypothetical protein FRD01_16805 [Microvenator marinus]|uniref:Uncharacterized protein n=1 Tax=Microvenator marinus TaxID=2600177 RepID=A0A5B8XZP6_9DELT|nr:hypothetical protein [Microvenator marinus]QED28869.1 hypothetical protein FRD01_16805 [Microvenator marinus]